MYVCFLNQDPARKDELLRPTNPEAQKATLAASSQLKVTNRPNYKIKPKPLQSIISGKVKYLDIRIQFSKALHF